MSRNALKNTDPLDIDEAIVSVEKSFSIHFDDEDFKNIKTFGEFCDLVEVKTNSQDLNDCTTQQAFYKLKRACKQVEISNIEDLNPRTDLRSIFPIECRKELVKKIEDNLGIKLNILHPPEVIENIFILTFLVGLLTLFIKFKIGVIALVFSYIGIKIAEKFGNKFRIKTFGELTEKVKNETYAIVRSRPKTTNKKEVRETVKQIFMNKVGFESKDLHDEARFV